jgi:hypothetical protein
VVVSHSNNYVAALTNMPIGMDAQHALLSADIAGHELDKTIGDILLVS